MTIPNDVVTVTLAVNAGVSTFFFVHDDSAFWAAVAVFTGLLFISNALVGSVTALTDEMHRGQSQSRDAIGRKVNAPGVERSS